jgi:hypothetical protein
MSLLQGPLVVVAMPPAVLSLCGVVQTLASQLMARPRILDASSTCLIDEFLENTFRALTKGTNKGYFFDELIEKNADLIVTSICANVK